MYFTVRVMTLSRWIFCILYTTDKENHWILNNFVQNLSINSHVAKVGCLLDLRESLTNSAVNEKWDTSTKFQSGTLCNWTVVAVTSLLLALSSVIISLAHGTCWAVEILKECVRPGGIACAVWPNLHWMTLGVFYGFRIFKSFLALLMWYLVSFEKNGYILWSPLPNVCACVG